MKPNCLSRGVLSFAFISVLLAVGARADADLSVATARSSPDWLRTGTIYEVFPRNFSPAGDFNGITARLDELHDLGVSILWLMPIHPIGREKSKGTMGSPYAVKDYYAINPDYGSESDLKRLVAEAHKRGMKVIIDMVLNHTAWDSVLMRHPQYYKHDDNGKIISPVPDWADVAGLDYSNAELRDYMIQMLKHWIDPKEFDLDGFRCDVASMVPTSFWEEARVELTKTKPDFILLAEASKPELLVKAFDIDYDWPLLSALNNVLANSAPATEIKSAWERGARQFPKGSLHLRMSDNHDEERAVARFGAKGALAASVLMFSLDGVPLLYNGMETGDATESGDPALFEKMPIFWHSKGRPPFRYIYRGLAGLRAGYAAFRNNRVVWLPNSSEADLVTLMRADNLNEFVVLINFSNRPVTGDVRVPNAQEFKPATPGVKDTPGGFPSFTLKGFDYRIYQRRIPAGLSAKLDGSTP
jgi:glycosidase